jgi:hypothetical protein
VPTARSGTSTRFCTELLGTRTRANRPGTSFSSAFGTIARRRIEPVPASSRLPIDSIDPGCG